MKRNDKRTVILTEMIERVILERYLINELPQTLSFDYFNKLTACKLEHNCKVVKSKLFTVQSTGIKINDDKQILLEKSNRYFNALIKNLIFYYGKDGAFDTEKKWVSYIYEHLVGIAKIDISSIRLDTQLIKVIGEFSLINSENFWEVSKLVFKAIFQNKIHAGDKIMPYIEKVYGTKNKKIIGEKLKKSSVYDFYFDEDAILRCDISCNTDIFIKNLLNTIIFEFIDYTTRIYMLSKLQYKYPFSIIDKVFEDFN